MPRGIEQFGKLIILAALRSQLASAGKKNHHVPQQTHIIPCPFEGYVSLLSCYPSVTVSALSKTIEPIKAKQSTR